MKIDYPTLEKVCNAPMDWFYQFGSVKETEDGIYIHKNNGAKILAVAHLDSVNNHSHFYHLEIDHKHIVFNAHLDDRLGAYVILYLLPSLGLNFDILLTEGEELGRSTAAHFETTRKYNWMFSFDRHGTDVVMYDYESKKMKKKLRRAGFTQFDPGAFSDICFLDHLGCRGINIGTGYHNEHTARAYAEMNDLLGNVEHFVEFYNTWKDQRFDYYGTPAARVEWREWGDPDLYYGRITPTHRPSTRYDTCIFCHKIIVIHSARVPQACEDCGYLMEKCCGCDTYHQWTQINAAGFCTECQDILSLPGSLE